MLRWTRHTFWLRVVMNRLPTPDREYWYQVPWLWFTYYNSDMPKR